MESKIWLHSIIKDDTPIEDAEEEESRNVLTEKCVLRYFSSFAFGLFTFGVLLFKIYRINSKDGDRYRKEALSQQSYTNTVLNYQRGDVKDRNNTTLASQRAQI